MAATLLVFLQTRGSRGKPVPELLDNLVLGCGIDAALLGCLQQGFARRADLCPCFGCGGLNTLAVDQPSFEILSTCGGRSLAAAFFTKASVRVECRVECCSVETFYCYTARPERFRK